MMLSSEEEKIVRNVRRTLRDWKWIRYVCLFASIAAMAGGFVAIDDGIAAYSRTGKVLTGVLLAAAPIVAALTFGTWNQAERRLLLKLVDRLSKSDDESASS